MDLDDPFEDLVQRIRPGLQRALVGRYGVELGNDALTWAWEHRTELQAMANPAGYLYRVGQSSVRAQVRMRRRAVLPIERPAAPVPDGDPGLHVALGALPPDHRVAVVLVHAHGYSYAEAAEVLGVPVTTIRNHVHRGMTRLRREMESSDER